MAWNIMTWNTQLYEQGNSFLNGQEKPINSACYEKIFDTIAEYLESKNNSIAVLQEIPYYTKRSWSWLEHEIFTAFEKKFPKVDYDVFLNDILPVKALKMTVVIAKKGIIERDDEIDTGDNCFVGFKIEKTDLRVLAIHSHDASDLYKWLAKNEGYSPQIILGDFNAGNYKKKDRDRDREIAANRKDYLKICEGYIDLFQGCYTTSYKTHIDHVLIENSNEFHGKYSSKNIDVDYGMTLSDHYPLSFLLELQKNPNLPA